MIKGLIKLTLVLILIGGWILALSAVHIVRRPGPIPKVGMIQIIPKDELTFRETWLDMTKWSHADKEEHELLVKRLEKAKAEWISDLTKQIEKQVTTALEK